MKTLPYIHGLLPSVVAVLLFSSGQGQAVTFTTDTFIGVGNTAYDGMPIVVSNCTLTVDGTHTFASLQVLRDGNVTHSFVAAGSPGLNLTVASDVTVTAAGMINVDGRGYDSATGPGAGTSAGTPPSGSGAGHGGYGAQSIALDGSGIPYDSIDQPVLAGSGGGRGYLGAGGAGGGAVRLTVGGTLRVDGVISADGGDGLIGRSGGGSGGSIWLSAQSFAGAGWISANGGAGDPTQGGGGGGGCISIQYGANTFAGFLWARGGGGYAAGGAGTIYTLLSGTTAGQVLVDNAGQAGTNTLLSKLPSPDLTVQGGAIAVVSSGQAFRNLLVASNAWIAVPTSTTLNVSGSATIQAGGGILADGTGYGSNEGPGAGKYGTSSYAYTGGGGGYGGYGGAGGSAGASGGVASGSVTTPTDRGSGGGCAPVIIVSPVAGAGRGGGALQFNVTGLLLLDGRLSADGTIGVAEGSGGGSGGSILLNVGTLAGAGTISANGGAGNGAGLWAGGGGSGGRISITSGLNLFFGATSAKGGSGFVAGGAGTIYSKQTGQATGLVLVDNGGQAGTNTTLGVAPGTVDLIVRGGGVVAPPVSQSFGTLLLGPAGWLSLSNQTLTVTGNATIQAGGGIRADGMGYPSGAGTGSGKYYVGPYGYVGGGGGYGGYGGSGVSTQTIYAAGGTSYGNVTAPIDMGSGGGGTQVAPGGAGGGLVRLTVTGALQVDGTISASGSPSVAQNAGGGSGGTIYLSANLFGGSGTISANGGTGSFWGGGGGGGRIAVMYSTNVFTGVFAAYGGAGYRCGGAGTIFTKPNNQNIGLITLDNGGQSGTNTSWATGSGTVDMIIRGGAVFAPTYYVVPTLGNLTVASNGWLLLALNSGYAPSSLTITGNATVQEGGGIIGDGLGYPAGQGSGAGMGSLIDGGYASSGGGHGGYGGASGGNKPAPGGNVYDSVTAPASSGSGGGMMSPYVVGGAGGSFIRLNVTGALLVEGVISANGAPGATANAGGGSGGSIYLTVGTLAGSGLISADGGMGIGFGGGGGGGRVALQYTTSAFTGLVSAHGGSGYTRGGAGTIAYRGSRDVVPLVVVDNNGAVSGTNTSWLSSGAMDLVVKGGATAFAPPGQTFGNLLISSNGWLTLSNQITVTSNATIQAGGGIIADAMGYASGEGPGAGTFSSVAGFYGGGGGYGGYGGASTANKALGGNTYGSVVEPTDRGSGGGGIRNISAGGTGGGALRITVNGSLLVNGRISANGGAGVGQGCGGGSGGSVYLTAGTIAGNGLISANGGTGNVVGGGGGGGRISLRYGVNAFEGLISAYGGSGGTWGGAGTIYARANSQAMGQLLIDNGGHAGTNTSLTNLLPFDLTIKGAAVGVPGSALTLSNLTINTGGKLAGGATVTNLELVVLRNATVDAGGSISLDGKGFGAGAGPGAGRSTNSIGSGAGYGGAGGASAYLPGGNTYGSAQQPVDRGSGGGFGYWTYTNGGEGGGALRLTVGGNLVVNGRISANGNRGIQDNAGGGSGGSLWLTAGALAGAGVISADGGTGELYQGGGGGGGRIALYSPLNVFSGVVSAAGGDGASPGQAGSIYRASIVPGPEVVSFTPAGAVTGAVSRAEVVFNTPVDPYTVTAANLGIAAPGGGAVSNVTVSASSPCCYSLTFPAQAAPGSYAVTVGPQVKDLLGNPMSQSYTGAFAVVWVPMSVTSTVQSNSYVLSWTSTSGVTYQPMASTNLVDWAPYAGPLAGTGNPMYLVVPVSTGPRIFFRMQASY